MMLQAKLCVATALANQLFPPRSVPRGREQHRRGESATCGQRLEAIVTGPLSEIGRFRRPGTEIPTTRCPRRHQHIVPVDTQFYPFGTRSPFESPSASAYAPSYDNGLTFRAPSMVL
jgi:hypothetical protein